MQTPEPAAPPPAGRPSRLPGRSALGRGGGPFSGVGERLTWVAGLALALSAFTGWYAGSGDGMTISVIGWHTGTLGKLVFVVGVAAVALAVLREAGIALPATVPESLVVIGLGSLATIFVLVRVISIPDDFFFAGRGIGLWISLASAVAVIVAGVLEAGEEL